MKKYRVTYEMKGVRIVDVTVPDGALPPDFDALSPDIQDELLYERQEYSVLFTEDVDYGKAVSVVELRSNLRTVP